MARYVVCIDDDRDVLAALRRDLEKSLNSDLLLETCESAEEADQLVGEILAEGDTLVLVICDQVMPGEKGVHFLERLHASNPRVRKVLLTGYAGLESAIYGINRSGLDRYVEKPWDAEELLHTVKELVEEYSSEHTGDPMLDRFHRRDDPDLYAKVEAFSAYFEGLREQGFYLWQRPLTGGCEHSVTTQSEDGETRRLVMLASNNYLGLTTHPRVVAGAREALDRYGAGSGAVPLLSGTLEIHRQLEERLALFKGGESCCLFPTGYSANVGIISALARENDILFLDRLVHASIIDGARASGSRIRIFRHNDVADLERKLKAEAGRSPRSGKLVVVDAVYSMDGDIAPLPEIMEVSGRFGARVMVDEAHSTGVLGQGGRGIVNHFELAEPPDLLMGTLSKSLGGIGGFCVAPPPVVDYIRHYARSFIFSTSLPPATVGGLLAALEVLQDEPERVDRLQHHSDTVRQALQDAGLDTGPSQTAIIPIIVGDGTRLAAMSKDIHRDGLYLNSVHYPAVPRDASRLRISLMATHTPEELEHAVEVIVAASRRHGLLS